MNRKKYRDHPIIINLKKKNFPDNEKINLVFSIVEEDLLSYISIYLKDKVIRRTAFLRINDEVILNSTIAKIKDNEKSQNIEISFFKK